MKLQAYFGLIFDLIDLAAIICSSSLRHPSDSKRQWLLFKKQFAWGSN